MMPFSVRRASGPRFSFKIAPVVATRMAEGQAKGQAQ
jgi:hypothetical protein